MGVGLQVLRRFPTYDFAISVPIGLREAQAAVARGLDVLRVESHKGSFIGRFSPTVNGQEFELNPHASVFGGNLAPRASGVIVPASAGFTEIQVQVFLPLYWWLGGLALAIVSLFLPWRGHAGESVWPYSLTMLIGFIAISGLFQLLEGGRIASAVVELVSRERRA
jgi:hypothetical protein